MAEILKECGIDADIELEEGELKFDLQPPNKAPKKSLKNTHSPSDPHSVSSHSLNRSHSMSEEEAGIKYVVLKRGKKNTRKRSSCEIEISSDCTEELKKIKGKKVKLDPKNYFPKKQNDISKRNDSKMIPETITKAPTCRYLYVMGRCVLGQYCRFDHTFLKTQDELDQFLRENEQFLLDFYKAGKLKRLLYPFHMHLKRRAMKDPNFKIELIKPEPEKVDLKTVLDVKYDPSIVLKLSPKENGQEQFLPPPGIPQNMQFYSPGSYPYPLPQPSYFQPQFFALPLPTTSTPTGSSHLLPAPFGYSPFGYGGYPFAGGYGGFPAVGPVAAVGSPALIPSPKSPRSRSREKAKNNQKSKKKDRKSRKSTKTQKKVMEAPDKLKGRESEVDRALALLSKVKQSKETIGDSQAKPEAKPIAKDNPPPNTPDGERKEGRIAIIDKKFKLLFDKEFKEDKKKAMSIKEEIKQHELRDVKRKSSHSDEDQLEKKLGHNLDISDISSENGRFSEDDEP